MTYCLGMLLDAGLIMIADTRTNAGVDNFSSFKKLHTLCDDSDRKIFACTAGSLSISQSVIGLLEEGLPASDDSELKRTLHSASSMFRVAQLVGEAVQMASKTVGEALATLNISSSVSLLLGGRIGRGRPALFQIYGAGNFIECTSEVPFLQIGETKYGKPILDRGLSYDMPLHKALKVGFLSFDSAMRSNLGVARPLDLVVLPADPKEKVVTRRIDSDDEYFNELSMLWSRHLHDATLNIPDPPWMPAAAPAGAGT